MPNARNLLRVNLQKIVAGKKAGYVLVGHLTPDQLAGVNASLAERGFDPVDTNVYFRGQHIYDSRIVKDGYSIDDVIEQITNGMDAVSVPIQEQNMSAIRNETQRTDQYGSTVRDTIVFRCADRRSPELYSVIPKGDICPNKRKELQSEEATPVDGL